MLVTGFDLVAHDRVEKTHRLAANQVLSALALSSADFQAAELTFGTYGIAADGRDCLSYTFKLGAPSLVVGVHVDRLGDFKALLQSIASRQDLERVLELHAAARSTRMRWRAWLLAWQALELFVGSRSRRYGTPTNTGRGLTDRFEPIAKALRPDEAESDIAAFDELRKQRNDFVHGKTIADTELRLENMRRLLDRYVEADIAFGF